MLKRIKGTISLLLCVVLLTGNVAVGGEGIADFFAALYEAINIRVSAAESGTCGDNLTWTLSDDGVLTISGTGAMTNYYSDSFPWYSSRSSIKKVIMYSGLTSIGNCAFQGCSELTSVTIPNSVISIGLLSFAFCKTLISVTIPNSVTSIGDSAFTSCSGLASVTFGNRLTSIGRAAFSGCKALTSITIPNSVTNIGSSAFNSCEGLKSVAIPDSVTTLGGYTFQSCSGLTSVTIGKKITNIDTATFGSCTGLTSVTIPDSVTSIGESAFYYCTGLTRITVPNSVTNIGDSAFRLCTGLTSITIPNSVTSIGNATFERCTGLTSITIPNSVTSIGDATFEGCTGLTSITIPNSVTSIGDATFEGCTGLTRISIPKSITDIGDNAFSDCIGLTNVTIPNNVTSIGVDAFSGCTGLTSITIPNSVTSIGDSAFFGCIGLTSITVNENNTVYDSRNGCNAIIESSSNILIKGCKNTIIPDSVTSIDPYAFHNCVGLTNIIIPNSVLLIESYAFSDCTGLTSATIGNSVTSIGNGAFEGCTGLTSITIPNSVTSIGEYAFDNSNSLSDVYYIGTEEQWNAINIGKGNNKLTNAKIHYDVVDPLSVLEYIINDGKITIVGCNQNACGVIFIPEAIEGYPVTTIGSDAFFGCEGLTSITIPECATTIDNRAFRNCSGLTSITIPSGVTRIGDGSFSLCDRLTYVYYAGTEEQWNTIEIGIDNENLLNAVIYYVINPLSVLKYKINDGKVTISGCDTNAAGELIIPGTIEGCPVTVIGRSAFSGCKALTKITIPDGVTSIGAYAFRNCSGLTSITIPNGVTIIDYYAFENCSALTSITIPGSVTSINGGAFQNCSGLTNIAIPDGVTSIGAYAFRNCSGLTSITIPDSVTLIDGYAFSDCLGLTSITIPDSVTIIYSYTFQNCAGLASIIVHDSVTKIGNYAFKNSGNITDVYYTGTEEQWKTIEIDTYNEPLLNANIHYYDGSLTVNYLLEGADTPVAEAYSSNIEYNNSYSVESPVVTGYHLVDEEQTVITGTMNFDPVALNVYYAPNEYNLRVIYVMSDGSVAPAKFNGQVAYNTAYSIASPVITGYTPNIAVVEGKMDSEDRTVTVTYTPIEYKVTFRIDGKESTVKVAFGSAIPLPETPEKQSYAFAGWVPEVPATMPAQNLNFNATWADVYGIGEETYSFKNFSNKDIKCSHRDYNGHCFGMAATSSGYYIGKLDKDDIGGKNKTLYSLSINNNKVRGPICTYLLIQGPVGPIGTKGAELEAIVAGGSMDLKNRTVNTSSDWNDCVDYVNNHEFDYKGTLNVGVWYKKRGGHAVNFLYYKEVNGQPRIYVYDSNYPNYEMYYYKKGSYIYENSDDPRYKDGDSPAIRGIDLMDVATYFDYAKSVSWFDYIFTSIKSVEIENAEYSYMKCDGELSDYVIFKIPEGVEEVTITPLEDNASFEYMGVEYTFGKVDEDTYGVLEVLKESAEEGKKTEFVIENAPAEAAIRNFVSERTEDYRTTIKFTALKKDTTDDMKVHWYINNRDEGTGNTFTVKEAESTFTVQTKLLDKAGKLVYESEKETVKIKSGFFDKVIAFFRALFKRLPYIEQ